jgi:N-acetylmuramoyl-L-alanine amidase
VKGACTMRPFIPHPNPLPGGKGTKKLPQKRGWGESLGWELVGLMLAAALLWPVMTCAAPQSGRAARSKPEPTVKGAQSSGAAPSATHLWTVRDIRHWSSPNVTRVVIDVDGEVRYRYGRLSNPDRLYVDLLGAQMDPQLQGRSLAVADRYLKGVRGAQNQADVVRVVLELQWVQAFHIFTIADPYRLVIDIKGTGGTAVPPPLPPPAPRQQAATPEQKSVRTDPPATLKRPAAARDRRWHVVIDAGHGGKDPGAIGPSGVMEKDVVLDIARQLRQLFRQELQWQVTLTRESDTFIPLEDRTATANAKGADLFVSIHANSAERPEVHGIETYFLDLASDEQSMQVAARENATTVGKVSDLQRILRDLQMTSKRNESSLLAGSVQQALVQAPNGGKNGRDLGVKHAPFLVLMGAEMPAILVETGFLSNPGEERKLADPKHRSQAARAIFVGIKEYLAAVDGNGVRQVQR